MGSLLTSTSSVEWWRSPRGVWYTPAPNTLRRVALTATEDRPISSKGHAENAMNAKRKAILDRIESLQEAIGRANEYLESGRNARWRGFRPLFVRKLRDGKELPPHKDWVKSVFLPRMETALSRAEKILGRLG